MWTMKPGNLFAAVLIISTSLLSSAFVPRRIAPSFAASRHGNPGAACLGMTVSANAKNIEVVSQPDQGFLEKKGVFNWGTWGCGVSKFPWTYDQTESCYLLAGKVTVTPDDGRPAATFGKGDFVTFPVGMSCTWDVTEAVSKHFMFY